MNPRRRASSLPRPGSRFQLPATPSLEFELDSIHNPRAVASSRASISPCQPPVNVGAGLNSAPSPHAPTGSNGRIRPIMIGAALSSYQPCFHRARGYWPTDSQPTFPTACGPSGTWQSPSRNDADPRADLPQRPVALAAGRDPGRSGARGELGLLQGSRVLARDHRLHAEGLPDAPRPSELEGRKRSAGSPRPGTSGRFTVPGDGPAVASRCRRVLELVRRRLRGRQRRRARSGFPGGEVDLTELSPGRTHVSACSSSPCRSRASCSRTPTRAAAREVKGTVERRGLCGDVFLVSTPRGRAIADVKVDTSVRKRKSRSSAALEGLAANGRMRFTARIIEGRPPRSRVHEPAVPDRRSRERPHRRSSKSGSPRRSGTSIRRSTRSTSTSRSWRPTAEARHCSGTCASASASSGSTAGTSTSTARASFSRAVPLDNAQVGAALASYDGARETLERLKSFGINFVYTHNYGCEPGSHLSFAEILRAADDVGMLVGFSQPHFGHYDWKAPDADTNNGYARHAEFYVRAAAEPSLGRRLSR